MKRLVFLERFSLKNEPDTCPICDKPFFNVRCSGCGFEETHQTTNYTIQDLSQYQENDYKQYVAIQDMVVKVVGELDMITNKHIHDAVIDYMELTYKKTDSELVDISVALWKALAWTKVQENEKLKKLHRIAVSFQERNRDGMAGQAFTNYQCLRCDKTFSHPSTNTPCVCGRCTEEIKEEYKKEQGRI